jgi:putative solute:sodium symporter small subunit
LARAAGEESFMSDKNAAQEYWKWNRLLIAVLLSIWFLVSFVFAIFLAEPLYSLKIGQLPSSFWWAHQGSMIVFVLLILVYALVMDRLDRKYGVGDDEGDKR